MAAVADLGYADCTATAWRPSYLPPGSPRAALAQPAWVRLDGGRRVLELPTTHSLGAAAKGAARPAAAGRHVHFHDYELLETRRAGSARRDSRLLARRRRPVALDALDAEREVGWDAVCAD